MHHKFKICLAVIILLLATAGCTLSTRDSQPAEQGAVETQVAETMGARDAVDTQVAQTVEAQGAVETRVAQTIEAQAGAQDDPADSQQQEDEEEQDETPPEPTATSTSTPTPTEDYKPVIGVRNLNLGGPDELYEFEISQLLYRYSNNNDRAEFKDGKFVFSIDDPITFDIWAFSSIEAKNYYFEITVEMPNCSGSDRAGIIFRTPLNSYNLGYIFQITCDGYYRLTNWDGNNHQPLINWTEHTSINTGSGAINRIGVYVEDTKMQLFVNAIEVNSFIDATYKSEGKIGLVIGVEGTQNFEVKFDDAAYWRVPG